MSRNPENPQQALKCIGCGELTPQHTWDTPPKGICNSCYQNLLAHIRETKSRKNLNPTEDERNILIALTPDELECRLATLSILGKLSSPA